MHPIDRFLLKAAGVCAIAVAIIVVANVWHAGQRTKQRRTMATLRNLATWIEAGHTVTGGYDGWGRPLRIQHSGTHYSIRSAAADGVFERGIPRGPITEYKDDLVYIDATFAQYPEGI